VKIFLLTIIQVVDGTICAAHQESIRPVPDHLVLLPALVGLLLPLLQALVLWVAVLLVIVFIEWEEIPWITRHLLSTIDQDLPALLVLQVAECLITAVVVVMVVVAANHEIEVAMGCNAPKHFGRHEIKVPLISIN